MPTSESEQNAAVPSVRKRKPSAKVCEGGGAIQKKSRQAQPSAGPAQSSATPHPPTQSHSKSNTVHGDDINQEIDNHKRGFKPRTLPKEVVHELTDSDDHDDANDDKGDAGEVAEEDEEAELGTFEIYQPKLK